MLDIEYHNMFRKDYKKYLKNGFDSKLLDEVVLELRQQKPLAPNYKDHTVNYPTAKAIGLFLASSLHN